MDTVVILAPYHQQVPLTAALTYPYRLIWAHTQQSFVFSSVLAIIWRHHPSKKWRLSELNEEQFRFIGSGCQSDPKSCFTAK